MHCFFLNHNVDNMCISVDFYSFSCLQMKNGIYNYLFGEIFCSQATARSAPDREKEINNLVSLLF